MHLTSWICLLLIIISLFPLVWSKATENEGIVELLQELRKEPPPEPVWMLHEVGSILDDTWNPNAQDNGKWETFFTSSQLSYLMIISVALATKQKTEATLAHRMTTFTLTPWLYLGLKRVVILLIPKGKMRITYAKIIVHSAHKPHDNLLFTVGDV